MRTLSVTDVVRNFSDYVNQVAYRGEVFLLVRGGKPLAELRPTTAGRRLGDLPAVLAGLPRLDDRDAAAFAKDIGKARASVRHERPRDPWAS